ncbi:MAG: NTP transferase domain-containing protein [Candidatus Heimdallarchaeota archaeon]|nr:MAG: NTP transferase domain-containing protein [Candidatus Heimdallarchaeota archaeon]
MTVSAFILAAGKGTRLYPFTSDIPKPMLPLLNKPIIHHSIERLLKAGIQNIGVVIGKDDTKIPQYIQMTFPNLYPVFIVQKEALGTAHAVLQIERHLKTDDFLAIAGDSLFSASYLRNIVATHVAEKNAITLSLEKMEFNLMKHSSTVNYHDGRVLEVREKPQTPEEVLSDLNSAALYGFSYSIFKVLKKIEKTNRGEYELATAINEVIHQNYRVGGVITERVCHITTSHDLWHFNLQFLREVDVTTVDGNFMGKDVDIDESAVIQDSILGDNSVIKKKVIVKNSVIFPDTIVNQNCENSLVKTDYLERFTV